MAVPEEEPCPTIPLLATLPVMLMVMADRSMPFTVGAMPFTAVSARL